MKKFGFFRLFFLLVLVLILSVLPQLAVFFNGRNITKERLWGKEAEIKGVLVVWNVDSFEGAKCGKSSILESVSKKFEAQNKGAFVLVKNVSIEEFLASEVKPDVVSFGSGMFDRILDFIVECEFEENLFYNVEQSALMDGKLAALPWCLGAYYVFATEESLARANASSENLIANCMNAAFERKVGKRTKNVFSLELGVDGCHSAKDALAKMVEFDDLVVDADWKSQTYYEAYEKFVGGASTYFLGTQRDLARFENKQSQGAISGYFAEMLMWTDLVQYCAPLKTNNKNKLDLSKRFCEFLMSDYVQEKVVEFGMLPVVAVEDVEIVKEIEKLEIKNIY